MTKVLPERLALKLLKINFAAATASGNGNGNDNGSGSGNDQNKNNKMLCCSKILKMQKLQSNDTRLLATRCSR